MHAKRATLRSLQETGSASADLESGPSVPFFHFSTAGDRGRQKRLREQKQLGSKCGWDIIFVIFHLLCRARLTCDVPPDVRRHSMYLYRESYAAEKQLRIRLTGGLV
jgi:hypothetical protein